MSECKHLLDVIGDDYHGKSKVMCFLCDKTEREIELERQNAELKERNNRLIERASRLSYIASQFTMLKKDSERYKRLHNELMEYRYPEMKTIDRIL